MDELSLCSVETECDMWGLELRLHRGLLAYPPSRSCRVVVVVVLVRTWVYIAVDEWIMDGVFLGS